jgi:hypothetical protein
MTTPNRWPVCAVEGCTGTAVAAGLCVRHIRDGLPTSRFADRIRDDALRATRPAAPDREREADDA